jgi:hypothetical protein
MQNASLAALSLEDRAGVAAEDSLVVPADLNATAVSAVSAPSARTGVCACGCACVRSCVRVKVGGRRLFRV